ncbi:MAG: integrase arm-type DNA-binding domain-containing protein [Alphaproteobacteria bacterium]|nr:integrase arm-type DNA-binding domain-containing protein [Alphaproteobacteria bacterium]
MAKLTKRFIDAAKPGKKEYFLWDGELKGFGLRIYPTGRKVFVLQYRTGGRERRLKIGPFGALTVDEARELARQRRGDVARGKDPSAERNAERKTPNISALCSRFLEEHVAVRCKPSTQREYRLSCNRYIIPEIGSLRVTDVTRADLAALHQSLNRTPYQANRVLATLSKMFTLAELWGIREEGKNPARHIPKFKEKKRDRFLSADEIARLWTTLDNRVAAGSESIFVASAFKMLLLTGCRLSEIRLLRWEYIRGDVMILPDSKTGRRRIALSPAVLDILGQIPRRPDNPYVVCGKNPGEANTDLQRPWRRIREEAKLNDVRIHDLRHTYASWCLAAGHSLFLTGRLLGHTQAETTNRYAHLADSTQRDAVNATDVLLMSFVARNDLSTNKSVH